VCVSAPALVHPSGIHACFNMAALAPLSVTRSSSAPVRARAACGAAWAASSCSSACRPCLCCLCIVRVVQHPVTVVRPLTKYSRGAHVCRHLLLAVLDAMACACTGLACSLPAAQPANWRTYMHTSVGILMIALHGGGSVLNSTPLPHRSCTSAAQRAVLPAGGRRSGPATPWWSELRNRDLQPARWRHLVESPAHKSSWHALPSHVPHATAGRCFLPACCWAQITRPGPGGGRVLTCWTMARCLQLHQCAVSRPSGPYHLLRRAAACGGASTGQQRPSEGGWVRLHGGGFCVGAAVHACVLIGTAIPIWWEARCVRLGEFGRVGDTLPAPCVVLHAWCGWIWCGQPVHVEATCEWALCSRMGVTAAACSECEWLVGRA
jgi:hypothetical protein